MIAVIVQNRTAGYSNWGERLRGAFLVTFPALLLCLALDFVGGGVLGKNFDKIVTHYPLLLVILPGMMDLRGNVFGSMASRLTTALYLGKVRGIRDPEVTTNITLAITSSSIPLMILWVAGVLQLGFSHSAIVVLAIVVSSALFIGILLGYSTAFITVIPYRHSVDPDTIAAPLITSVADVITIPSLVYMIFFYEKHPGEFYTFTALMLALFGILILRSRFTGEYRKSFREIALVLTLLAIMEIFSGSTLEYYSKVISRVIILSIMYPSILDSVGNFSSIVAATTSTRLNLAGPSELRDKNFVADIGTILLLSPVIGILTNLIAVYVSHFVGLYGDVIWAFVITYPLLVIVNALIGIGVAYIAYTHSIDPDNVAIPTVTTISDVLGTLYVVLLAGTLA
ncbi:magnesium transporter [Thermococcus radiotolerans]|uniref:Magnesium transporter n=1 Tax=Thermococcus radiotolerans TaxID=187880 RepID=A0A2Z2MWD8_9EURY|nr:magnesium transporter [Thermococcus radiotolerans]ASJ13741.1 magnesium transporter [Thermococcus radiotolerans]